MIAFLKQGAMFVCPHAGLAGGARCIAVKDANLVAIVTERGVTLPVPKSAGMRDFGDPCGELCKRLLAQ
jgi:hypothetical protein